MKKKVLSLAVLMASVFAFNSMAQAPASASDNKACPAAARCKGDKGQKADRPNPFDGINLSAEQQTRLQAMREKAQKERQAAKADKATADSTARADRRAALTKKRQDYLVEVKEILTPDQYVMFLENCYVQQAPGRGGKAMAKGDKRGGKDGMKAGKKQLKEGKASRKADRKNRRGGDRTIARADKAVKTN